MPRFLLSSSCVPALLLAATAHAQVFQPHEASYSVTFQGASGATRITGSGTATIRLEKTCAGWALAMSNTMNLKAGERPFKMQMQLAMSEKDKGRTYESRLRMQAAGRAEDQRGVGRLEADGTGVGLVVKSTGRQKVDLPKGTIFPISHTREIVKAALAGQAKHSALVFDADASSRVMQVITEIKPAKRVKGIELKEELRGKQLHSYTIRYYAREDQSSEARPAYRYVSYDNGIALVMTGGMAGLSVTMRLVRIKALKPASCEEK